MCLHAELRWRGDYGGKKQLWFPANYVEEVSCSPTRELDEVVSVNLNWAALKLFKLLYNCLWLLFYFASVYREQSSG